MTRFWLLVLAFVFAPAAAQERVVSVGGAVTEIVYALGEGARLVAADSTSTWPVAAAQLPRVGYMRALSAEGVLSLRPGLVLVSSDAGPASALSQLRDAGVPITVLENGHSLESLRANIHTAATALGVPARGKALVNRIDAEWLRTQSAVKSYATRPRALFLLAHAGSNLMVAGEGTSADAMIRLGGGVNALSGFHGYKPLTAEAVIGANPEIILITSEGLKAFGGADKLWSAPGLALTPAALARRVVDMNALYLLGFGPRLPQAVRELAAKLHTP